MLNCLCVWEKHIKAINMCKIIYKTLLLSRVSICFNILDWIFTCWSAVQFTIQILIVDFDIGLRPDSICIVLQFGICCDPLDRYFDLLGSVQLLILEFLYENILTKLTLFNCTTDFTLAWLQINWKNCVRFISNFIISVLLILHVIHWK